MNRHEIRDKALSADRLEELRPSTEARLDNTRRAKKWYNEAPLTAADIFIRSAEKSQKFHEEFMSEEIVERYDPEVDYTFQTDKWRSTMREELPELHEELNSIGLSAFQGKSAEKVARKALSQ